MNFLMLSCKKSTELMDRKAHAQLGLVDNFQLMLHRSMCDACRLYERQGRMIDTFLHSQAIEPGKGFKSDKTLPEEVKSKIIEGLKNT